MSETWYRIIKKETDMAKWVSDGGVFVPANERVGLTNNTDKTIINPSAKWSKFHGEEVPPGADYIYEGQCRDALRILKDLGLEDVGFIGDHFTNNPDMFQIARTLGYDNVEDYAKKLGYDESKAKEIVEKHKQELHIRREPKRVSKVPVSSGGRNQAGTGGDIDGGWEKPKV